MAEMTDSALIVLIRTGLWQARCGKVDHVPVGCAITTIAELSVVCLHPCCGVLLVVDAFVCHQCIVYAVRKAVPLWVFDKLSEMFPGYFTTEEYFTNKSMCELSRLPNQKQANACQQGLEYFSCCRTKLDGQVDRDHTSH